MLRNCFGVVNELLRTCLGIALELLCFAYELLLEFFRKCLGIAWGLLRVRAYDLLRNYLGLA